MAIDMDATDHAILGLLQQQGRMTNAELAGRVHRSESACLRRVRRLEAAGVIEGYGARLNHRAIGRGTDVFVEISLHSQSESSLDAFEAAVADCPEVTACYLMSGDADYMLHVLADGIGDYERIHRHWLSAFPGVSKIHSGLALRTVFRRNAVVPGSGGEGAAPAGGEG